MKDELKRTTTLKKRRANHSTAMQDLQEERIFTSKDPMVVIKEKLLLTSSSPWFNCDLLYHIPIYKKGKVHIDQSNNNLKGYGTNIGNSYSNNNSYSNSNSNSYNNSSSKTDKYLLMVRKKELSSAIYLMQVICKDNEIEMKHLHNLNDAKALDYGSDANELILSTDSHDFSLFFGNQTDRDETLWIIAQVCKTACSNHINIGYSIDMDALGYLVTSNGTLTKFSFLQKMIKFSINQLGEIFNDDEIEAEKLLDEMGWNSSDGAHVDLQQTLSKQANVLHTEIIDFLLQWEELDEENQSEINNAANRSSVRTNRPSSTTTSNRKFTGMRDTREVLTALAQVDTELEGVDRWLFDQIERLSVIQSNLRTIEDESSSLETSWQNLSKAEEIIRYVVDGYTIKPTHEDLLCNVELVINDYFKSNNLAVVPKAITELEAAAVSLKHSITLKLESHPTIELKPIQWKEVQKIQSVKEQKQKLSNLADQFSKSFHEIAYTIFEMILKHKSITDSNTGIFVKQMNLVPMIDKFITPSDQLFPILTRSDQLKFMRSSNNNQILKAQNYFQIIVSYFGILLSIHVELAQISDRVICESYMRTVHDRLHSVLFKTFFKDLSGIMTKHVHITFNNIQKYKLLEEFKPVLKFGQAVVLNAGKDHTVFPSWRAFQIVLIFIAPVIEAEEAFLKGLFNLKAASEAVVAKDGHQRHIETMMESFARTRLFKMLEVIFDGLLSRIESMLFPTQTDIDGMEAIAMLRILHYFTELFADTVVEVHTTASIIKDKITENKAKDRYKTMTFNDEEDKKEDTKNNNNSSNSTVQSFTNSLYLFKFLEDIKSKVVSRIGSYCTEQIHWISVQKGDPKNPGVLLPFAKFPSMIAQIEHLTAGEGYGIVEETIYKFATELFNWLANFARQNEKHKDKIKITNFTYFLKSIQPMNITTLQYFLVYATQQTQESTIKYVNWMVSYEFPSLSALASRMDGVGSRVHEDEMSMFVRRKDVLNVIKELELKTLEVAISNMRKRLEKHFKSEYDMELHLVSTMWANIRSRIEGILVKLEEAALASYQITLEVGPEKVLEIIDKHSISTK